MQAVWYEKKGPAKEVLIVGEMPDPEPKLGEVRVRIHVSAVNPSDTKSRTLFSGPVMPFPRVVPGQDGSGVIDRVGPGVPESRIGQRVWIYEAYIGRPFGTAAQYCVLPSHHAIQLPDSIDFDNGAGLGVPALTAHHCLFADGGIQGKTVLVQGGGGGVGYPAVQMAKWAGARVIATVSRPAQEQLARQAGADVIIHRKTQKVTGAVMEATHGQGVDRVIEVDFGQNLETDYTVLKPSGVIATYMTSPLPAGDFPFRNLMWKCITVRYILVYTMSHAAHEQAIRDTTAMLEAGRYHTHVGARFKLDQLAEAHDAQDSGEVIGKILVDVS
jgi:NADPH:quinone reductase